MRISLRASYIKIAELDRRTIEVSQIRMSTSQFFSTAGALFIIFLAAPSSVKCGGDVCGINGVPEFPLSSGRPQHATGQEEGLGNKIWALVPSYVFSCPGVVARWRAHVESWRSRYDRYDLKFSVWRRVAESPGGTCSYEAVGENSHTALAPEVDAGGAELGYVTLEVSENERFAVEPGDFVGFTVGHYVVDWPSGVVVETGTASLATDRNETGVAVYVWQPPLPSTLPCIASGQQLPERVVSITAAPIITADMSEFVTSHTEC